ncbi:TPA: hypothetical protein QB404_000723 [Pasteurella multocida]|nr:hypothetical protein [Pasteurella multocida]
MSINTYLLHLLQSFDMVALVIATVCLAATIALLLITYVSTVVDKGGKFSISEGNKQVVKLLATIGFIFMLIAWFIPPFQTTCGG